MHREREAHCRAGERGEVFVHGVPLHGPGMEKEKGRRGATCAVDCIGPARPQLRDHFSSERRAAAAHEKLEFAYKESRSRNARASTKFITTQDKKCASTT